MSVGTALHYQLHSSVTELKWRLIMVKQTSQMTLFDTLAAKTYFVYSQPKSTYEKFVEYYCSRDRHTSTDVAMITDEFCIENSVPFFCEGEGEEAKHNVTMCYFFPKWFGDVP